MNKKSILLVDDETVIASALSRELENECLDFDIHVANSGEEAMEQVNTLGFDLVVTDRFIPGLDDFQVLKAVKDKDPQAMVIIFTGSVNLQSSIDALRLGADDFVQKPCDTEELLSRIFNCFVNQDLQRKVRLDETIAGLQLVQQQKT
ncbi:MAG: response regulator [Desulfobulbus sp.]